ncbi:hypothetical protein [Vibrio splendidus]|uniref:hypothetical protein n=1 Tax=Vibrio splendidus TaxID=29497 RepID=UPI000D34A32D|nr:hypothetical protein [Vibrio splendidus]PTP28164.1 hypothetical protein CWN92_16065 [Vibrio splendidus]
MENRIKYTLYLKGWNYEKDSKSFLKAQAEKALVTEFEVDMHNNIYCPECCAPLFRSPRDKDYSDDGRAAYFAHKRSVKTICGLRTKKAEGKKYLNEEEAQKAIQDEELVIVEGFIKDKPIAPDKHPKEYDQTEVEELDGPETLVPIGRHSGEVFKLPSKFKTVKGIVKNFDENLIRYFYFPNSKHAVQLQDYVRSITSIKGPDDKPKLYFGTIVSSFNAGKKTSNIRMTKLKYNTKEYNDFFFKVQDKKQQEKGINDDSKGRVILMYGKVTISGSGLCIEGAGWGEFALLPKKYEGLLKYV